MTYINVGDRVCCDTHRGTVIERIPQKHTSDLFRIDWDDDHADRDLYADTFLTVITTDDITNPWCEAPGPRVVWRAA